jgi:hypothetical protein
MKRIFNIFSLAMILALILNLAGSPTSRVRASGSNTIVYSGVQNIVFSQYENHLDPISLFGSAGTWDDLRLNLNASENFWWNEYWFENMLEVDGNHVWFSTTSAEIRMFSEGELIDGNSSYPQIQGRFSGYNHNNQQGYAVEYGAFRNTTGYAGFQMTDGANIYYGWMQVSVTDYNNANIQATLIDWAYEITPNTPIAAGNTFAPDTTAPTTTIDSGPNTSTKSTSATFTFSGTDNVSVPANLTFVCGLDGGAWAPCTSPQTYTDLSGGPHYVYIHSFDEAGNHNAPGVSYSWTVDTQAPIHTLLSGPTTYTTSTSATWTFTGEDNVSPSDHLTFQCKLDDGAYSPCSSPKTYTGLAATFHKFFLKAVDEASNVELERSYGWWVQKERAKNGGFNTYTGTSKIPTSWVAANFAATDGKDTTAKKEGTTSVKIAGALGKTKTLTQTLPLSGVGGDQLTFSFWAKGTSIPTAGVCKAEVLLYNGATLVNTKAMNCANGTYAAFKPKTLTFSGTFTYTKVVIKLTYAKASGIVWFDAVSLIK